MIIMIISNSIVSGVLSNSSKMGWAFCIKFHATGGGTLLFICARSVHISMQSLELADLYSYLSIELFFNFVYSIVKPE